MILDDTFTLSNGVAIPKLGLGTWFIDDEAAPQAVRDAVAAGYLLIDTAQAYGNERGVGEGVRTCGIAREELFVTTTLAAEIKDEAEAAASIDESLERMGLDCLDRILIHSPQPWAEFRGGDYAEGNRAAWAALEAALEAGKLRAIGVSNFERGDLERLLETATVTPHANQLLVHAGNTPVELMDCCAHQDILVEAYSPIGHGAVLEEPTLVETAARYGVSVPQLCIRYVIELGTVALPKTANPEHMRSNAALDFELSAEDVAALTSLHARDYGEHSAFPVYSGK